MTGADDLRVSAVASLEDLDQMASGEADALIGLDGEPCSDNEAALITSATSIEHRLAEALRGPPASLTPESDAEAIAGLLRLAAGAGAEARLSVSLGHAFLIPDDSRDPLAREERAATFCDLYRRLALPGLAGEAQGRADELLVEIRGG